MIHSIEIETKTGFNPWKPAEILYPQYRLGKIKHRFLWWHWETEGYINIDGAELAAFLHAKTLVRIHLKKGVTAARIVERKDSLHQPFVRTEFYGTN